MGVVLLDIAKYECLSGGLGKIDVEYNSGDIVHVQMNNLRFELSLNEYLELSTAIIEAGKKLRRLKDYEPKKKD